PDPVDAWWQVARSLRSSGKQRAVWLLAKRSASRPDIQAWLIAHGWENDIDYGEIALACAEGGRLAEILKAENVDTVVLDGASILLSELVPFTSYPDGLRAVGLFLRHVERHPTTAIRFYCLRRLSQFLDGGGVRDGEEPSNDWKRLRAWGWTAAVCDDLLTR